MITNNPLYASDRDSVSETTLATYVQAARDYTYFTFCANFWFDNAPNDGGEFQWERGKYYDRLARAARSIIPNQYLYIANNEYFNSRVAGYDSFTYPRQASITPAEYGEFAGALG